MHKVTELPAPKNMSGSKTLFIKREKPREPAGLRNGVGTTDGIANTCWTIQKSENFRSNFDDQALHCVDNVK